MREQLQIQEEIMNKSLQERVNFANFAIQESVDPHKLGEFCSMVIRRKNLACRIANAQSSEKEDAKDDRLCEEIVNFARNHFKWEVTFPSVYPSITKDGKHIYLPL